MPPAGRRRSLPAASGLRSSTTEATPATVSAMPSSSRVDSTSPMMSSPYCVVMGGTMAMRSMDTRAPTRTKARKRQRSPTVKPTSPDTDSHSQAWADASTGKATPRVIHE